MAHTAQQHNNTVCGVFHFPRRTTT